MSIVSQLYKILKKGVTLELLHGFESRWIPSILIQPKFALNNTDLDTKTIYDIETESDIYSDIGSDSNTEDTTPIKLEWLNKLEKKVKALTTRVKDKRLQEELDEELDAAFLMARKESHEATSQGIPSLAVTQIPAEDVERTFKLKRSTNHRQIWHLRPEERRPVPDYLRSILVDYDLALGESPQNEAFIRARVDAVLLTTLARKKREELGQHGLEKSSRKRASTSSVESFKSLHWQFERHMKLRWPYRDEICMISGKTDYSLWYGDPTNPQSNLVVVETKRRGNDGRYRCLCYMGKAIKIGIIPR
ncbi:hypothetical protein ABOM_012213 [Aspergillus bombycis]|uniref:Uncharacterized protein n=1 Tax=Aspergillus bombycis TaxID=109264 RepID=A0A1F7ZIA0_9EURO|nr:hypothetical protein ABOM_012213 [Aspergillus bombycis]OGM39180.1 hypothetical protein ABOM_012213 [Aspergillus bombycis]